MSSEHRDAELVQQVPLQGGESVILWVQRTSRHRAVEVIDSRTLTAHFLTDEALAAGRLPKGRVKTPGQGSVG